ncbi:MAG: CCA tRNA nucleotidyltransferase [Bacilli bacterium]|nr:CCA tRNA nucleotidyltransferase [Bacilli bacterium]
MNIAIPKPVNEVMTFLNEKNYEAYLIGSTIRNMVMNEKPKKYLIATNASIEQAQKILSAYSTYTGGENNKVLTVLNNRFPMEITQYRTKSLEDDLAECDFTMNALAYSDEDGLIDYNTGIIDINNRIIRLNGDNEELLKKDPLRILRAIRLSAEYTMKIDITTQQYMFDNRELLKTVAPERIREELNRILMTDKCAFYLKKYLDIFVIIIPELALMEGFNQNTPQHIYDALEHTFVTVNALKKDPDSKANLELTLAALLHDIAKPYTYSRDEQGYGHFKGHAEKGSTITREIMNRLKYSKKQIQKVTKLIEYHDSPIPEDIGELRLFINKIGTENIQDLYKLRRANIYAKNPAYIGDISKLNESFLRIKEQSKKTNLVKKQDLKIDPKELLELGIPQEKIGIIIDELHDLVLRGVLKNNHDKLLSYVVKKLKEETPQLKVA